MERLVRTMRRDAVPGAQPGATAPANVAGSPPVPSALPSGAGPDGKTEAEFKPGSGGRVRTGRFETVAVLGPTRSPRPQPRSRTTSGVPRTGATLTTADVPFALTISPAAPAVVVALVRPAADTGIGSGLGPHGRPRRESTEDRNDHGEHQAKAKDSILASPHEIPPHLRGHRAGSLSPGLSTENSAKDSAKSQFLCERSSPDIPNRGSVHHTSHNFAFTIHNHGRRSGNDYTPRQQARPLVFQQSFDYNV